MRRIRHVPQSAGAFVTWIMELRDFVYWEILSYTNERGKERPNIAASCMIFLWSFAVAFIRAEQYIEIAWSIQYYVGNIKLTNIINTDYDFNALFFIWLLTFLKATALLQSLLVSRPAMTCVYDLFTRLNLINMKVVLGCLINFCLIYESVRPLLKHVHIRVCVAFLINWRKKYICR